MGKSFGCALLALATLLAPGVAASGREETKEADRELRRRVNDAIDRGARWLADRQDWDGSFPGPYASTYPMGTTALALLALLHSGVPKDSKSVSRALTWMRARYRTLRDTDDGAGLRTYSVSVAVMALVEYGRGPDGTVRLNDEDRSWLVEMTDWLVDHRERSGVWRYPGYGGYDHSNTQYALLALKEASTADVEIDPRVFATALAHLLATQERDGPDVPRWREHGGDGVYSASREREEGTDRARGWGYIDPASATGSMTAAGVAAVAVCRSELDAPRYRHLVAKAETSLRDGLAWLGAHFSVTGNPPVGSSWHFYYLYGLERAGVLGRVVFLGEHRWYAEGARYLVDLQKENGAWRPMARAARGPPVAMPPNTTDQAFALLFLARATTGAAGVATERPLADLTSAGGLNDDALRTLFDAAFAELGGLSVERAASRRREFAFLGPRVIPLLLPKLLDSDVDVRGRAVAILRAITGKRFDFDPEASEERREAAADRWTGWYLANRGDLALDREARLLR